MATYVAEDVFPGWESLPGIVRLPGDDDNTSDSRQTEDEKKKKTTTTDINEPARGISETELQGPAGQEENRFTRLYREIVRRNAKTVAAWQAYGFMNGVLNTDNTSIFGLCLDFGPFAFMDNFDPSYTPNHDDHYLRYSYKNQPSVIWWNLVRLGEALGELIGAADRVDDTEFIERGMTEEFGQILIKRAETIINRTGEEYKYVFKTEYIRLMSRRLGLLTSKETDFEILFSELLDTMEQLELDFNHFFRKLSVLELSELETEEQREDVAKRFFHNEGVGGGIDNNTEEESASKRIAAWLMAWRDRIREDWIQAGKSDEERRELMKSVNPKVRPDIIINSTCRRTWIAKIV